MFFLRIHRSACIISLICACIFSNFAEAADISSLQTALMLARGDMEKAKNKHEANTQAIAQQKKIVAERQKQLADENKQLDKMQKDAKQDLDLYLEAKQKYEKAQSNFNAAWGKK